MKEPDQLSELWVVYEGKEGPGKGKRIVFVSGDEEYRSEEALPMLARILAFRHGFHCTVLFATDPQTGEINPECQTNIPGLETLGNADLMVIFTRFRELPDDPMKHVVDFVNSGKPIVGLRTATHAFSYSRNKQSPYAHYSFDSAAWDCGFGRNVLGETWINHHGHHGKESTRGVINSEMKTHPILRGVEDIWGPTDVYGIKKLTGDAKVLVLGQVLSGMNPGDAPNLQKTLMPLAWIKNYRGDTGKTSRVFCTTLGASVDLKSEGLRRLLVNASYWGVGLEEKIPAQSPVDVVGEYTPTFFGFGKHRKGMRATDYKFLFEDIP